MKYEHGIFYDSKKGLRKVIITFLSPFEMKQHWLNYYSFTNSTNPSPILAMRARE